MTTQRAMRRRARLAKGLKVESPTGPRNNRQRDRVRRTRSRRLRMHESAWSASTLRALKRYEQEVAS